MWGLGAIEGLTWTIGAGIISTGVGKYASHYVNAKVDMAGKKHPVTNVEFDADGFPMFDTKYSTQLNAEDYVKSRSIHSSTASKLLYSDTVADTNLKNIFSNDELIIFKNGGVPKKYVWHHHQNPGLMQLVDRKTHMQTEHIGGYSIWGSGK